MGLFDFIGDVVSSAALKVGDAIVALDSATDGALTKASVAVEDAVTTKVSEFETAVATRVEKAEALVEAGPEAVASALAAGTFAAAAGAVNFVQAKADENIQRTERLQAQITKEQARHGDLSDSELARMHQEAANEELPFDADKNLAIRLATAKSLQDRKEDAN